VRESGFFIKKGYMSELPSTADVVIIGGGVMGASAVYHLASQGIKDIVLLEKEEYFGQGSTGRCAGGVRYQFATDVNIRLSLASIPMLERFELEHEQAIDYRKCGYLFILTNEKDVETFHVNVSRQHRLGVRTQWLSGNEVRERLPMMIFPDALAGTFYEKDGLVDPNSVVMGYIKSAKKLGAKTFTRTEVTGILTGNGMVNAVETNRGVVKTRTILNTAGAWAGLIGEMAGVRIPIDPIRRQIFTTSPLPEVPADFPFVIDFSKSLYFHREGDGLLIGMSNLHEQPGFATDVDENFETKIFDEAYTRMPLLENAGRSSHWAGLYEVTPDAHPILGSTNVRGFYVCAGFSGHGFMHGPIAGKLMSELIQNHSFSSVDVSMLDLARFEEGRPIQEYNVV